VLAGHGNEKITAAGSCIISNTTTDATVRGRTSALFIGDVDQFLKWAWNESHAFMVLSDDAKHSDQTGGGKLESARYSPTCYTLEANFLEII
jgi:hypothetical protein